MPDQMHWLQLFLFNGVKKYFWTQIRFSFESLSIHQIVDWILFIWRKYFSLKMKFNFIKGVTLFWIAFIHAHSALGEFDKMYCNFWHYVHSAIQSYSLGLFYADYKFFYNKNRFLITGEIWCTDQIHFYYLLF